LGLLRSLEFIHFRLVDRYRRLRHQVHGLAGWQERQFLETHLHDDFGDGVFDLAFELCDGFRVYIRYQSDFLVLSVFN
jgi:hypothetical protein